MKLTKNQKIFVVVVVLVNAILWIVPSDVVESVARDRHILLGRYSRRHFAWVLALIPISAVALYLHLTASAAIKKKRAFRVVAVLLVLVPSIVAVDVYLRLTTDWGYELGRLTYHRTPGRVFEGEFSDGPEAARTYPKAPPGFGTIHWTLTSDQRGFRNFANHDRYDVVALGDSFTEGSHMTDGAAWPARLAALSGASVYNLGMSGYAPHNSLAALEEYGLGLKPECVILLLYEGNDFKQAKVTAKQPSEWQRFFKRSPVVSAIDDRLIRTLGPIGAHRELAELEILSWLPLEIPEGSDARYYAFPPSILVDHYVSRSEFESGKHWARMRHNLDAMRELCAGAGVEFVVAYAPTKARVVLPLVRGALPADKVRSFVELRAKRELPPADVFLRELFDDLDVKEQVTQQWCESHAVRLVSLTAPLRDAVREGTQVYFTYNDHWSPPGHEVAAEVLSAFWRARQAAGNATTQSAPP